MRLPPEPLLVAAKRWLEILPSSGGIPRANALLATHAAYSDLTPTQYSTALAWLREVNLLDRSASGVPAANRILAGLFEKAAPPWLRDADTLVLSPDDLPSDIVTAGEALGLDASAVYEQMVRSWAKVDTAARKEVGTAGEVALAALLAEIPDGHVDHVASRSDGFGYDITFSHPSVVAHLEVKTTTRVSRFTAYLSRHEYEVMLRDEHWTLVTVRLGDDLSAKAVGSVPREWIAANVPQDRGQFGNWASVKLEVPLWVIADGIPPLKECSAKLLPTW